MQDETAKVLRDALQAHASFVALYALAQAIVRDNVSLIQRRSETALAIHDFSSHILVAATPEHQKGAFLLALTRYCHTPAKYRQAFLLYGKPALRTMFDVHWAKVEPVLRSLRENADGLEAVGLKLRPLYKKKGTKHPTAFDHTLSQFQESMDKFGAMMTGKKAVQ